MMKYLLTLILLAVAARVATAQGTQYHLASAQVVQMEGGPRLLLAADGPVAHAVEPEPDGAPAPAGRLRLRLYGVTPAAGLVASSTAPFAVQATPVGRDTVLLVEAAGVPPGTRLVVGPSTQSSHLTILVR